MSCRNGIFAVKTSNDRALNSIGTNNGNFDCTQRFQKLYERYLVISSDESNKRFFDSIKEKYMQSDEEVLRQQNAKYLVLGCVGVLAAYVGWKSYRKFMDQD